jgi:hypothetical protein
MGALALPVLGEVTVKTQHLVPFWVSVLLQPSMQNCATSYLFPMPRALSVHVVYSKKDWPRLAATCAAWVTVRAIMRQDFQLEL